jgi:hypothetical protein
MRKIKEITVGGITGTGETISYPVDVYGETYCSDEIFNASNITQSSQQPHRGDPAPTQQWPDSTFSPNFDITPKPPGQGGNSD